MICIRSLIILASTVFCSSLQADVTQHLNQISTDPNALYAFFKTMPKGGELHYHLWGSSYAESILEYAAKGDYCLNKQTFALSKNTELCDGIKASELINHPEVYTDVVRSWSLKDFVAGKESAFEHFFASFIKYLPVMNDYSPELLTHILQRAADQHEHYMELMIVPNQAKAIQFSSLIHSATTFKEKRDILLADKHFLDNIAQAAAEPTKILEKTHQLLGCTSGSQNPVCKIKVNFLVFTLREQPLDSVFAQTLTTFEATARSNGTIVGVNSVQPENGIISLRDYRKHMEMFQYFHSLYPQVKISLHAGELEPESVTFEELGYHIHDAVFTGHASRIGHGVDIAYENDSEATLKFMAEQHIAVEVNLVSNEQILRIKGRKHPLNYYLAHHVPVVLSTDDEGILRTDLTRQYVDAVLLHGLNYPAIKQINRNALTYAFLPGKSIWADPAKALPVTECQDLNNKNCLEFIKGSEKARIQWDLEKELAEFESRF